MIPIEKLKALKPGSERGYSVSYAAYKADGNDVVVPDRAEKFVEDSPDHVMNSVCFAEMKGIVKNNNRLIYLTGRMHTIPKEELEKYFEICKQHNALPDYMTIEAAKKKAAVIKLTEDLSPSLLYVYLCVIRMAEESPGFVSNFVELFTKHKLPFASCWFIASAISIGNGWHNIVQMSRYDAGANYNTSSNWSGDKVKNIDVVKVIGLQRYIKNSKKYDNRKLSDIKKGGYGNGHGFDCGDRITKISTLPYEGLTARELSHELISMAVESETDEEAAKCISKWEKTNK